MTLLLVRPESPPPSPEQLANAIKWGIDPYDVIGLSKYYALPRSRLNPAAVIHDERFLYVLSWQEKRTANNNFIRDAFILAKADESTFEEAEVEAFRAVLFAVTPFIDTSVDRNTDVTRMQGMERMTIAMIQVNAACKLCDVDVYYPEVEPRI